MCPRPAPSLEGNAGTTAPQRKRNWSAPAQDTTVSAASPRLPVKDLLIHSPVVLPLHLAPLLLVLLVLLDVIVVV